MDRLEHYRQCIQKLLIEDSKIAPINGEIEVETIFDKEKDRYLAVDLGWDGHRRVYNCVFIWRLKMAKSGFSEIKLTGRLLMS